MNRQNRLKAFLLVLSGLVLGGAFNPIQANEGRGSGGQGKPNVIFVLTDDQGYGDLSCHGNPILKTPNLDKMHEQSVRFTDYHVSPLCTPTRGALMTGRDPGRNGAYRTSAGRSILHTNERTLGNLFADNGYVTGMRPVRLDLGNPTENPVELCSKDWYMEQGNPPWNFRLIGKLPRETAPWMVNVKKAGRYRFTLRQYPKLADKPVKAVRAKVEIAGLSKECEVKPGSKGVVIEMDLPAGETKLITYLYDEKGAAGGAYFTEVEAI